MSSIFSCVNVWGEELYDLRIPVVSVEWRVIVLISNARSTNNKYKQCALSILTYLHLSLWLMNKHWLQKIIVKKKCWPPVHKTKGLGSVHFQFISNQQSSTFFVFCLKTLCPPNTQTDSFLANSVSSKNSSNLLN